MAKTSDQKPARKRPTRAQLDKRLSLPLGPKRTMDSLLSVGAESEPADPVSRQRARDRAGDEV